MYIYIRLFYHAYSYSLTYLSTYRVTPWLGPYWLMILLRITTLLLLLSSKPIITDIGEFFRSISSSLLGCAISPSHIDTYTSIPNRFTKPGSSEAKNGIVWQRELLPTPYFPPLSLANPSVRDFCRNYGWPYDW